MKQPSLAHVLQPKWRTALQRLREERASGGTGKFVLLALVGGAFWAGVFGVLYRILKTLRGVEELGPLIPGKMLGLILLSFISILVLSNVITALSSFFLAKDLDLLVSAPVDWLRLYLAKLGETLLHSSWMVALMAVPVFAAYGVVFRGGPLFVPYAVMTLFPLLVLFAPGFTKAQEGAERFVRGAWWRWTVGTLLRFLPVAKGEFVIKDIKLFFRDTTQWSQLILLAVLVVVYLFNIMALPLHRGEQVGFFYVTLVSFLNLGLAGFVLAAIAARFIFPAVSLEGRHMWLLRSSPLDLKTLLWSKYWVGTVPLLVLALLLTGLANVLLQVRPFMMIMGMLTIGGLTFAIAALALGFGALYPQFETENAAQIPTSFGGLVYMMATIALLGAVLRTLWTAVYAYVRAVYEGQPVVVDAWMISWFAVAAVLCAGATALPLWVGLRRMERFEF